MLFRAHRLFDGRTPKVFRDWVVEVEDGRILDVGPRSRAASGSDAGDVVDLGDVTLMPGLVDAHQHLVFDASDDPVGHLKAEDDADLLWHMQLAAQRALAVGITTIRDLGDRNYLSLVLRDWFLDGARGRTAHPRRGTPDHGHEGSLLVPGRVADGEDGVRRAVRERAARGVDVVKIMATGGNMTPTFGPHESQYSRAESLRPSRRPMPTASRRRTRSRPAGHRRLDGHESRLDRALHVLHR